MEKKKNEITEDLSLVKESPKAKEDKGDPSKMTPEVFDTIQSQNMGDGLLQLEPKEDPLREEPIADITAGAKIETLGKYSEEIMKDILNNPAKYKFKSKKHGDMNLKDAMDKGYNPDTDEFDKPRKKSKEELMEGLSDSDKESINNITDPASAQVPEKDAEALGIKDERFIKKPSQEELFIPEAPIADGEESIEGEDAAGMEDLLGLLGGGGQA